MSSAPRPRTGAHRPRRDGATVLVPLGLGLAVVLVLLVAATGLDDAFGGSGGTTQRSARPSATRAPASPTSSPSSAAGPSGLAGTSGSVDRSAALSVLNSTRRAGLATGATRVLRSAGWTVGSTGNYRDEQPPTTVYYDGPGLEATAHAVAADLGGPVRLSDSRTFGADRVTIVLGDNYSGAALVDRRLRSAHPRGTGATSPSRR